MSFLWLVFAHFIGDVTFQDAHHREWKGKNIYVMLSHCIVWAGVVSLGLLFLGKFAEWKWIFLILGHALIDKWRWNMGTYSPQKKWSWKVDQLLHYLQLIVVYFL